MFILEKLGDQAEGNTKGKTTRRNIGVLFIAQPTPHAALVPVNLRDISLRYPKLEAKRRSGFSVIVDQHQGNQLWRSPPRSGI
jgi:hypothetical protein